MTDSEARASEGLRFGCDAKALATALGDAMRGRAKSSFVTALRGVHMQADADTLTLTGCDMTTTVSATLAAEVSGPRPIPGAAVVADPAAMLALVKTLAGPVTLAAEGDAPALAVVSWTGARYTFETANADNFPRPAEVSGAAGVVNTAALLDVLAHVLPVVSKDESRPVLCGALVELSGAALRVTGTDSYRLASFERAGACDMTTLEPVVLHGAALAEVVRVAKRKGAPLGVAWQASNESPSPLFVRFTVGAVTVTTRRIEGQYPNWRQLVPETFEIEASMVGAELAAACKRVASIMPKGAGRHYNPLRLTLAPDGGTTVAYVGQDGAGASETLPTPAVVAENWSDWVGDGKPPKVRTMPPVGLNPAFLADAAAFCGETARVRIISPLRPVLFLNGRDPGEAFYLLMPVRLAG